MTLRAGAGVAEHLVHVADGVLEHARGVVGLADDAVDLLLVGLQQIADLAHDLAQFVAGAGDGADRAGEPLLEVGDDLDRVVARSRL